jgi:hypothetical protein
MKVAKCAWTAHEQQTASQVRQDGIAIASMSNTPSREHHFRPRNLNHHAILKLDFVKFPANECRDRRPQFASASFVWRGVEQLGIPGQRYGNRAAHL